MSSSQLWTPQPQRAQNAAASLDTTTSPSVGGNNFLSLSPTNSTLPSPALKATEGSQSDDIALAGKFLTNNNGPVSRASSFSSTSSAPRHPPLGQKTNRADSIERRELAVGRAGGITSAFLSNH